MCGLAPRLPHPCTDDAYPGSHHGAERTARGAVATTSPAARPAVPRFDRHSRPDPREVTDLLTLDDATTSGCGRLGYIAYEASPALIASWPTAPFIGERRHLTTAPGVVRPHPPYAASTDLIASQDSFGTGPYDPH